MSEQYRPPDPPPRSLITAVEIDPDVPDDTVPEPDDETDDVSPEGDDEPEVPQ
ncbi:MAG: hypothetical protein J2P16_14285 [Mycobacterium sp.]|nr:hypothetical protein [Mycobacterium sp.]